MFPFKQFSLAWVRSLNVSTLIGKIIYFNQFSLVKEIYFKQFSLVEVQIFSADS